MMEDLEGNDMLTKEQYFADPCKAGLVSGNGQGQQLSDI